MLRKDDYTRDHYTGRREYIRIWEDSDDGESRDSKAKSDDSPDDYDTPDWAHRSLEASYVYGFKREEETTDTNRRLPQPDPNKQIFGRPQW